MDGVLALEMVKNGVHFEHTIVITKDGYEILTKSLKRRNTQIMGKQDVIEIDRGLLQILCQMQCLK